MDWLNRIDQHQRDFDERKERKNLIEKIAEIEECACDLHDAFFGHEFDRDALLRSEEFLMEYVNFLKGIN
jgi:hypothetical protein